MQNPWVTVIAILVVGAIEGLAIINGVDGTALAGALAVIGGIAGYSMKSTQGGTR